ncbi:unnamed protein product [Calicophoron daubneyi]
MDAPLPCVSNNQTPNRATLAVSALDNVSPVKSFNTTVKSTDGASEWATPGLSAPTTTQHDIRSSIYSALAGGAANTCSRTSAQHPESPAYVQNSQQPLLTSAYQENYQNSLARVPYSASAISGSQSPHPASHIYQQQQQQQTQSFNHALLYVNKIKNRFQGIPDVYRRFLDVLQWYQKEQHHSDPLRRKQAELQVYQEVAKLFDGQEDLLTEFSQFLPESTGVANLATETIIGRKMSAHMQPTGADSPTPDQPVSVPQIINRVSEGISLALSSSRQRQESLSSSVNASNNSHATSTDVKKLKRLAPAPSTPGSISSVTPVSNLKKAKTTPRDVSIVDVNQLATGLDASLLHKATSPHVCQDVTNSTFTETKEKHERTRRTSLTSTTLAYADSNALSIGALGAGNFSILDVSDVSHKRLDLDFTKLQSCGTSYRALPANFPHMKCSGRQKCPIAKEVLNDSYISFSSLTSEDSQFVSSKKNQYEENMYRIEDERYEVDMVVELNRAAMQNLVIVKRKMDRMSRDELNHFHLDDNLSGSSAILMRKAVHRVYGDKAGDVIYGLKNCPSTVVPLVIQRMRQKDSEWREAIRNFQRSWADQDVRNYLRSLDHQGATFKQRDAPLIRSKTMVSQIEAIAHDDKPCHQTPDLVGSMISASLTQHCLVSRTDLTTSGTIGSALINVNEGYKESDAPHLSLVYPPPNVRAILLEDAASLIIHHVKRQSNTSKEDKRTMKFLIRTVVQDIFMADRFPMSDDEEEEEEEFDRKDEEDVADGARDSEEGIRTRGGRRHKRIEENHKCESAENQPQSATEAAGKSADDNKNEEIVGECSPEDSSMGQHETTQTCTAKAGPEVSPMDVDNAKNLVGEESVGSTRGMVGLPKENLTTREIHPFEGAYASSFPKEEFYSLLYGNNHWYSFIRLHHLLLCRLQLLRSRSMTLALQSSREKSDAPVQAAEVLRLRRHGGIEPSEYYDCALNLVKDFLDGGEDVTTFEDRLRDMFGIFAYPWFTMDRLIINIVRQLQALASGDELSRRLTALFRSWTCGSGHGSSSNSPFAHRINCGPQGSSAVLSLPQHSGVRGPLCTRACRLVNEAAYRVQAIAVCNLFAGQTGGNFSVTGNGGNGMGTGHGNGNGSNGFSPALPNCYALVMLKEASTMLIRLIEPSIHSDKCDVESAQHVCPVSHQAHWNVHTSQASESPSKLAADEKRGLGLDKPARHWFDYLAAHLIWTLGYVPHNIGSRIRPVFLYRTVRRCVNALTRRAYLRRQQQLVETGDTQPEEILVKAFTQPAKSETEGVTENTESTQPRIKDNDADEKACSPESDGSSTVSFEHDVWVFMCHVFKSDLTRKELFRDTFSSDCMQSADRLTSKANPRAHKINWSVGSYGIFIRRKRSSGSKRPSPQKWHEFHAQWLEKNSDPKQLLEVSHQLSKSSDLDQPVLKADTKGSTDPDNDNPVPETTDSANPTAQSSSEETSKSVVSEEENLSILRPDDAVVPTISEVVPSDRSEPVSCSTDDPDCSTTNTSC